MMMPYYGGYDYITAHYFNSAPSTVDQSTYSSASVTTCYSSSGCLNDHWFIYSTNANVLAVENQYGVIAPRPVLGVNPGTANLTSSAYGPINPEGTNAYVDAYPVQVQVKARCFAQLKYRAVTVGEGIPTGFNHAFWWIQRVNASQQSERWVIAGGPQNAGCTADCGYLRSYPQQGDVGHYPADNSGASTTWASALSSSVCGQVTNLYNAAFSWPQSTYVYNGPFGPNSNTFAHTMGNAAPF